MGRERCAAFLMIGLKTDHIDLVQHHEILRFDDPDRIFGPEGAMEAVLEAKQAGKIRFIGFKEPVDNMRTSASSKSSSFKIALL